MELTKKQEEFIESLITDDTNLAVLIYGSRIKDNYNVKSDLDIFLINQYANYRMCIVIDGVDMEINCKKLEQMSDTINRGLEECSTYLESVLFHSIIIKDTYNIIPLYKEYINQKKQKIDYSFRERTNKMNQAIYFFYINYLSKQEEYDYYNLIEQIRKAHTYSNRLSHVNVAKIFDLYGDKEKAINDYCLKLPEDEFIELFMHTVDEPLNDENLYKLFTYIGFENEPVYLNPLKSYNYNATEIKNILLHMYKVIEKTSFVMRANHPYKDYLYYITLERLNEFYLKINHYTNDKYDEIFNLAKQERDCEQRIKYLLDLFKLLENKQAFDYKNYILYLPSRVQI